MLGPKRNFIACPAHGPSTVLARHDKVVGQKRASVLAGPSSPSILKNTHTRVRGENMRVENHGLHGPHGLGGRVTAPLDSPWPAVGMAPPRPTNARTWHLNCHPPPRKILRPAPTGAESLAAGNCWLLRGCRNSLFLPFVADVLSAQRHCNR